MADKHLDNKENTLPNGGTIQFSLHNAETKKKNIPGRPLTEEEDYEMTAAEEDTAEEEFLKNQSVPTQFEDVFSDEQIAETGTATAEGVVAIEEVFKQKADMINEDFHNETGEAEPVEEPAHPRLRRAAIIVGVISGAIILAAIAIAVIILL